MRVPATEPCEPGQFQQLLAPPRSLFPRHFANSESKLDVLRNGHMTKNRVVLKDESGAPLLRRQISDIAPVQQNPSARWLGQAGDHPQYRAFTAATGPEQHEQLLVRHFKRDVVDDPLVAEALGDLFEND